MTERSYSSSKNAEHNINIKGRRSLHMSGVYDVLSFDEGSVVLQTIMGTLSVEGEDLRIASFVSPQDRELTLENDIRKAAFRYESDGGESDRGGSDRRNFPGNILIEGSVNALIYTDDDAPQERGGLFGIFRKR